MAPRTGSGVRMFDGFVGRKEILLDLSVLTDLPSVSKDPGVVLLVPQCFDDLIRDPDRINLVAQIVMNASKAGLSRDVVLDAGISLDAILSAYFRLKEQAVIRVVPDELASAELLQAIPEVVRQAQRFRRQSRPTWRAAVSQYVVTILEHSKERGVAILSRGNRTIRRLLGRIAALQLPDRSDDVVKRKQEWFGRVFSFRGGRALKYFLFVLVAAGGLQYPPVGGIGLALAFMDP